MLAYAFFFFLNQHCIYFKCVYSSHHKTSISLLKKKKNNNNHFGLLLLPTILKPERPVHSHIFLTREHRLSKARRRDYSITVEQDNTASPSTLHTHTHIHPTTHSRTFSDVTLRHKSSEKPEINCLHKGHRLIAQI